MTPAVQAQYRTAQDKLTRDAVGPVLVILNAVPVGVPVTPEQWARLVALVLGPTSTGRRSARDLARELYATQAPSGRAPDVPVRAVDLDALTSGLERAGVREALADPDRHMQGVVQGASVVSRYVEQGGRDYTRQATFADETAVGWARVSRGARTCAFCLMLISRGPVYHSSATAGLNDDGTMNAWHIRCDCQAVPVFDPDDWVGREQFLRAQQAWADTTGEFSGAAKLTAFRRAIEERSPEGSRGANPTAEMAKAADPPKAPADVTDDEMADALQAAIDGEDWDRFEALSEESDRRDEVRERRARESAARSERRRRQRTREESAKLDLMSELIERGVSEGEAYAQAYGTDRDAFARERAVEQLRGYGYQGSSFEKLARQSYKDYVSRAYLEAEDDCRGELMNALGERKGIHPKSLFSGPYSTAMKYASEELVQWWEENGRLTFNGYAQQLLGDVGEAQQTAIDNRVVTS